MSIFGAVIMVLAVAIGPFAQQLLSVRNCMIPSQTTFATIPRQATYFDFGEYSLGGPYYDRPPFSMQSSIYAAIYAPQANTVPITCASGNCSFPEPYHTFAYCSRCKDVSNQLRHTAGNNSYNTTTESNYTLPSGTHVYSRDTGFTSMYMRSAYQSGNHTYEVVWGDYKQLQNCTASQKSDPASSWQCQGYGATECSIKPCIRTYVAEVRDAKAEERLLHSTTDFDYTSVVHVPCLTGQQRRSLINKGHHITDTTEWLSYNDTLSHYGQYYYKDSSDVDEIVPVRCLYQIDIQIQWSIGDFLRKLLQGNITYTYRTTDGPDILHKMYNKSFTSFNLVNDIFRNISDGITSNIRQIGNETGRSSKLTPPPKNITDLILAGNQLAMGTVSESDICVQIRWGWLGYSASIIILAVLFVVCTIFDSSFAAARLGNDESGENVQMAHSMFQLAGVWKSSVVPLMFHGLEDQALRGANPSRLVSSAEMEEVAKGTKVRLMQGEDGWKLTKLD
jgi:hypothetical protein